MRGFLQQVQLRMRALTARIPPQASSIIQLVLSRHIVVDLQLCAIQAHIVVYLQLCAIQAHFPKSHLLIVDAALPTQLTRHSKGHYYCASYFR